MSDEMSYSEVFRKHYVQLIQCLPMDDDIFTAKLFQKGLLPYNWKAKLKSLSTSAAKATEFLDNIIKPNILAGNSGNFTLLLSVMKDGGDNNIVKLADTIMSEISLSSCCATDDAVQWFSEYLKEGYIDMGLAKRDEEIDPWPPIRITSFTTPVFIHHKQLQTKPTTEAATHERACGNIEDIPEVIKAPRLKSIEEIFDSIDSKYPNRILIEGHSGIGKTTLSKEICVRWAKGELLCSDKLVFLLFLRDPAVQKITNEQQLIEYFATSTSKVKLIQDYLEERCGADVTLIVDGFDELNVELCRKSFFTRLMKRKLLNKARIVMTSRPFASICFHEIVDKRIEILGFEKSTREQYINEALKKDPEKVKKLLQHLWYHPNINAVCYIPLVLNIMIFLCMLEYLPPTTTKMYTNFILHTICRHLKRKEIMKDDEKVTKMEEFPKPVCDVLKMLEKVAFDGLIQDRIVFEDKHLPDHEMCRNDPTCFGLLQSTKCFSANGVGAPVLTFNFYHLELQEYFAAKHVMSLPEGEAYDLIRRHFFIKYHEWDSDDAHSSDDISDGEKFNADDIGGSDSEDMQSDSGDSSDGDDDDDEHPDDVRHRLSNVWIFLFGLTKGDFAPLQRHLSTYSDSDGDEEEDERSLDFMPPPSKKLCVGPNAQFISELDSQSSSMPSGIQSRLSQDILLDHAKILFLFQCFREAQNNQLCKALHKNFREGCINLENQVLYPHHVVSLGLFLSQSRHKWKTLNLAKCCLLDEDLYDLHHYLCVETNRSTVEEFNISGNDLTEESSSILTEVISQLQPTCLKLSDNWIRFAGLKHLCSEMTEISTIKTLCVEMIGMKLNGITITTPDKEVISNMMSSLSELYMGRNGLYDEGAELLSEGLVKTSSLTVLSVWNCNIFTKGAVALANALSKNTSLETLDLRSNDIGDDGAVAFANVLSNDNETLTFLNVQENTFSPKGIKALQEVATAQNKYYFACSWTEMVHANIKYM